VPAPRSSRRPNGFGDGGSGEKNGGKKVKEQRRGSDENTGEAKKGYGVHRHVPSSRSGWISGGMRLQLYHISGEFYLPHRMSMICCPDLVLRFINTITYREDSTEGVATGGSGGVEAAPIRPKSECQRLKGEIFPGMKRLLTALVALAVLGRSPPSPLPVPRTWSGKGIRSGRSRSLTTSPCRRSGRRTRSRDPTLGGTKLVIPAARRNRSAARVLPGRGSG